MSMSSSDPEADGDKDGWDAVARDLLSSSQEDSDEAAKCQACRSESASVSDEVCSVFAGHAESPQPARSWWAELIRIHAATCIPSTMTLPDRAITLVSACSGICAEGEALKARGLGSFLTVYPQQPRHFWMAFFWRLGQVTKILILVDSGFLKYENQIIMLDTLPLHRCCCYTASCYNPCC